VTDMRPRPVRGLSPVSPLGIRLFSEIPQKQAKLNRLVLFCSAACKASGGSSRWPRIPTWGREQARWQYAASGLFLCPASAGRYRDACHNPAMTTATPPPDLSPETLREPITGRALDALRAASP